MVENGRSGVSLSRCERAGVKVDRCRNFCPREPNSEPSQMCYRCPMGTEEGHEVVGPTPNGTREFELVDLVHGT